VQFAAISQGDREGHKRPGFVKFTEEGSFHATCLSRSEHSLKPRPRATSDEWRIRAQKTHGFFA
jgi:hypothetical protein